MIPHNSRGCYPAPIRIPPAARGSSLNRTTPPKCLLAAETPYITCANTHTNSESQCPEFEIDGHEMREPSGAGLRKSLYSQRMLPACRHLWRRQHPAPASVPRRGKAHSTPSPLGDGAAGRAWITVRASTFRALATAHLRCSSRASRSPRERRSLSPQRGPARPPPATTAVPRPRLPSTARQPYQGAPARSRRRWAARRPPWPHSAARRARTRRPPGVPRGGAHRCAAKPPRLREPE